ncbi:Nif3-like dinuclear metal center hexameric protein [Halosimplex litoreum]|uniref:Nif3-like dinuclear metal center hexameric protein n=1 Tax=Halosimplex litoreum TaxID=1198301 RepID=A0A7T3FXB1_9EURY|nr:Nif3-like dinuclear metal center hexameric protein [Halosimplex litoreum]QPV62494.1 Nif3-like dinuclear metal center hexameric protein [Halosimplex litoreum]
MDLSTVCERYDERLSPGEYADVDASANGLQVGPDEADVETVAFAVDAAGATIDAALDRGADLLVVHHGLSWGGIDRVTGLDYDRIAPLIESDLALYAMHLPLDGHDDLGNAAGVADLLGLEAREPFGEIGPVTIGQRGRAPEPFSPDGLASLLESELDTGGEGVQHFAFGPDEIEDVAVVTGGSADWLEEAIDAGVDAFVTGEGKGKVYHQARDAGVNVFLGGHYATETFGVQALQDLAEEWGLETTYVDHPTGL